ncbi:unnamed protein product [Symbiodinium sp. KB8]|nr:unnamed protein product [Symbiodinium sp. KB8]
MVSHLQPFPVPGATSYPADSGVTESSEDSYSGGDVSYSSSSGLGRLQASTRADFARIRGPGHAEAGGEPPSEGFPEPSCDLPAPLPGWLHPTRALEPPALHQLHLLRAGPLSEGGHAPLVGTAGHGARGPRAGRRLPGGGAVRLGVRFRLGRRLGHGRDAGREHFVALPERGPAACSFACCMVALSFCLFASACLP